MAIAIPVTQTKIATATWGIPLTNEVNRVTDWTNGIDGPWTAYTPTVGNWTLGNGVVTGWYQVTGTKTVDAKGKFLLGSTSVAGASQLIMGLPPINANTTMRHLGKSFMVTAGVFLGVCVPVSVSTLGFYAIQSATGGLGSMVQNNPSTFASGHTVEFQIRYEAA